jgi:Fur family transcriptional regulator, peroxide stress response regulator
MAQEKKDNKTEALLRILEEAGKRNTAQRYEICKAIAEYPGHPTVADLYDTVRARFPMISQATVYNTVDTLRELGAITRLEIANHDHTHYDTDVHPHVNIVCRYCERIQDLHTDLVHTLIDEASRTSGFDIRPEAGLILYGICPDCKKNSTETEE